MNKLIQTGVFLLLVFFFYNLRPFKHSGQLIFNINYVVFIVIICYGLKIWQIVYPNFSYIITFLKISNIVSKTRRLKVTDRGGGSVVIDLLFNVLPIVSGIFVFVFVLLCITVCPF